MKKIEFKTVIYIVIGLVVMIVFNYYLSQYFTKPKEQSNTNKLQNHSEEVEKSDSKEVELNEAQFKAASVELGAFSLKNLSEVVNANGYTKLPPQNQADVSVYVTGVITKINVIEGQRVQKGQVLALAESPEFAKIQEAYITSKSNLEFLTKEYERQKTLSDENVNSKKVFQRTKADFDTEKGRFASLSKQLSLMNLGHSSISGVMPLVAPISGYVTEINIKMGSNAEVGKPLLSIVDNSKLHVDLLVYEKDLGKVKPGQTVRFVLTNQNKTEIKGKIFNISQSFENETKSVAVHADILNSANTALISGMYVNALIDVGTRPVNALPAESIVRAEGREFIFILEEDHPEESHDHKKDHTHKDGDQHQEKEKSYHFKRVEVKSGVSQFGYVQVTPLEKIPLEAKIVLAGAYYIQSHLLKTAGGGGHEH